MTDVEMDEMPAVFEPPLDSGIDAAVRALIAGGIETFESCEGGAGHAYAEPTVRFHGNRTVGFRALAVALEANLPVVTLRRIWPIIDGEPTGPYWEITLRLDHRPPAYPLAPRLAALKARE